jgi:hypothetical protein
MDFIFHIQKESDYGEAGEEVVSLRQVSGQSNWKSE